MDLLSRCERRQQVLRLASLAQDDDLKGGGQQVLRLRSTSFRFAQDDNLKDKDGD